MCPDSDDEGSPAPAAGAGGMSQLLGRGKLSKASLAASAQRRTGGGADGAADGVSSDDEDGGSDADADSGAENDEADEARNPRERKKESGGRDHELVHTARMKQQGIRMEEEGEGEEVEDDGDEGKESDFVGKAGAARAGGAAADGDAMDESEGGGDRPLTQYEKMKALFDKKKDDKYMTFDADDPLKPNPSQTQRHTHRQAIAWVTASNRCPQAQPRSSAAFVRVCLFR